jgi:hypothetical protein
MGHPLKVGRLISDTLEHVSDVERGIRLSYLSIYREGQRENPAYKQRYNIFNSTPAVSITV